MFGIRGNVLDRLCEEMADPTLRERKFSPKIPTHTFTDEDKERLKQHILTMSCSPQLEDGFPSAHCHQKSSCTKRGN